MEAFKNLESCLVPLAIENVDTDQIIPARFLKATSRDGFGDNLFRDWRFDKKSGKAIDDFILNNPLYNGEILLCGKNFGCGSSREHAAWALYDYGFRIVISSYFADIFKNNALNNGLLPIEISDEDLHFLFSKLEANKEIRLNVDLGKQEISISELNFKQQFAIHPYMKYRLLNGMDDIDYLLSISDKIKAFESKQVIY
jgi:3-isopropylmalate/(R)-2-methylmalate dehydratase small subunit